MRSPAHIILTWYAQHGRVLPWRETSDAYAIFMSELMLQQTQVTRVIPLWENWLRRFPHWTALAQAKTADIIQAWTGLGYNRRALYAREAAQWICTHGLPKNETEWRALKGVGSYMAAALTAFIQHQRTVVVDTNVRRVISRVFLNIPFPDLQDDVKVREKLQSLIPLTGKHWDIHQGLMDIASEYCFNRNPDCTHCPLFSICKTRQFFLQFPHAKPEKQVLREKKREGKKFPDRIYRGRILQLLRTQKTHKISTIGLTIDPTFRPCDQEWIQKMITRMVTDGLLESTGTSIHLPKN
ncbi:hypothetical protein IT408_00820 [Candidatus Uhrbacteria bacterium]|nr:hypothetical protein [Candidatus Uhrbacteria bacterium]